MFHPRLRGPFPKPRYCHRANFARSNVRDFRAPEWSRDLREILAIDPLRGLGISGGDGWPPI